MNMYLVTITHPAANNQRQTASAPMPVLAPTEAKARFLALQTLPASTLRTSLVFATVVGNVKPIGTAITRMAA